MSHGQISSVAVPTDNAGRSLNPKIQQALGCLDLRLDDELTRYRRQRIGLSVAPIVLRPKPKPKPDLDLISLGAASAPMQNPETPPKAISFDLSMPAEAALIPYESEAAGDVQELAGEVTEPPNDYLESSEQLLKNLEREEAKVRVERGFFQTLATPIGIGSMLTLLVSSAMFGYVIMNPSMLSGIGQMFARRTDSPPSTVAATAIIPNSPPLDSDEFTDLGLNTLSSLRTAPAPVASPTPSISPSPIASASPTPAAPTAIVAPTPAATSTAPLPPVSVPQTVTPIVPSVAPSTAPKVRDSDYPYKLEVPYTGDQSLEAARQIVPDAFVRSDGKIQLGISASQTEAEQRAQKLKTRGLAAEVQQR